MFLIFALLSLRAANVLPKTLKSSSINFPDSYVVFLFYPIEYFFILPN